MLREKCVLISDDKALVTLMSKNSVIITAGLD